MVIRTLLVSLLVHAGVEAAEPTALVHCSKGPGRLTLTADLRLPTGERVLSATRHEGMYRLLLDSGLELSLWEQDGFAKVELSAAEVEQCGPDAAVTLNRPALDQLVTASKDLATVAALSGCHGPKGTTVTARRVLIPQAVALIIRSPELAQGFIVVLTGVERTPKQTRLLGSAAFEYASAGHHSQKAQLSPVEAQASSLAFTVTAGSASTRIECPLSLRALEGLLPASNSTH